MTMTINSNAELCSVQKAGGTPIDVQQILRCSKIAAQKAKEITEIIRKAIEETTETKKKRKKKESSLPEPSTTVIDKLMNSEDSSDDDDLDPLEDEEITINKDKFIEIEDEDTDMKDEIDNTTMFEGGNSKNSLLENVNISTFNEIPTSPVISSTLTSEIKVTPDDTKNEFEKVATQLPTNISQSASKPKGSVENSILIEEEPVDDLSAAVKKKKKQKTGNVASKKK